jgi:hypothetical protein
LCTARTDIIEKKGNEKVRSERKMVDKWWESAFFFYKMAESNFDLWGRVTNAGIHCDVCFLIDF